MLKMMQGFNIDYKELLHPYDGLLKKDIYHRNTYGYYIKILPTHFKAKEKT